MKVNIFSFKEKLMKYRPIPANQSRAYEHGDSGHLIKDVQGCISCAAQFEQMLPQKDDGNREALKYFIASIDEKLPASMELFALRHEFFKGRVFLELLWEYQSREDK